LKLATEPEKGKIKGKKLAIILQPSHPWIVFWMISWRQVVEQRGRGAMAHRDPFFSVIVPTYQRARQLAVCLDALARQKYPRDGFEVLIVDDGSAISPQATVDAFRDRINVRLLAQTHSGPAAARNYGARHAVGIFLVFTDDDCAPSRTWLQTLGARFLSFPDCALGGQTINGVPDNPYSTTSQLLVDYLYDRCNSNPQQAAFVASNNLALPAERFWTLGGFDAAWNRAAGEDREFCDRWISHGYQIIYVPEAVVEHLHGLTWRTFVCQHFNYGRGAFYFRRTYARRHQQSFRVERLSFYLGTLRYPFFRAKLPKALVNAFLILAAQVANAAGFFCEGTRISPRARRIPVAGSAAPKSSKPNGSYPTV
jgi:GT2 family glycosyltransferase